MTSAAAPQELRVLTGGSKPFRANSAIDIPEEAARRVPARSRSRCAAFFCAPADASPRAAGSEPQRWATRLLKGFTLAALCAAVVVSALVFTAGALAAAATRVRLALAPACCARIHAMHARRPSRFLRCPCAEPCRRLRGSQRIAATSEPLSGATSPQWRAARLR
jgi:hypothetical protein